MLHIQRKVLFKQRAIDLCSTNDHLKKCGFFLYKQRKVPLIVIKSLEMWQRYTSMGSAPVYRWNVPPSLGNFHEWLSSKIWTSSSQTEESTIDSRQIFENVMEIYKHGFNFRFYRWRAPHFPKNCHQIYGF